MGKENSAEFLVDTNVIIRFLANDDKVQSPIAFQLFNKAVNGELSLIISPLVVAECCWVLESKRYGYNKAEISSVLLQLGNAIGIKMMDRESVQTALWDFCQQNLDFVDAYLSAYAKQSGDKPMITWNKKHLKKLKVEWYTPEDII